MIITSASAYIFNKHHQLLTHDWSWYACCIGCAHCNSLIINIATYSTHCHLVDCSELKCGRYIHIHFPYNSVRYLAYMPYLANIFVSSTYVAITWKVCIAVGCVLAHTCKNVGSLYHLICQMCDLRMQFCSHICSVIYANMEFMLYIELYSDSWYTNGLCIYIYIYIICLCIPII